MGVKAVVEAIYEPPQAGELDGLTLGWPWEEEERIRALAGSTAAPQTIVGYIFTDLDPTPEDRTKNVYKRNPQSFFLSSLEAIFAATLQRANPTASKSSPTGQYASRLVTAVLTGTEDGQVDVSAYQVSEQAVAMVEADMIEASVDPGIVRVKEEDRTKDSARYVPDVFYSYRNEYNLEVKKSAKPCFPVEYLLVNVSKLFSKSKHILISFDLSCYRLLTGSPKTRPQFSSRPNSPSKTVLVSKIKAWRGQCRTCAPWRRRHCIQAAKATRRSSWPSG